MSRGLVNDPPEYFEDQKVRNEEVSERQGRLDHGQPVGEVQGSPYAPKLREVAAFEAFTHNNSEIHQKSILRLCGLFHNNRKESGAVR